MAIVDNTSLTATKNDLIVSLVQRELISKAVVMPTLLDASVYAGKGSKSINVPRAGSFAVEDRATGVAAAQVAVTYATDPLVLNQMSTVAWIVDSQDEIESSVDVQVDLASRAAKAQAKNFDVKVIAGLESGATATTTAGAITQAIFLEMRKSVLDAEGDLSETTFLMGTDSEAKLLAIADFVRADQYGSAVIPTGVLGTLYGVKVALSTNVAADQFYMYSKEGYAFAIQKQLSIGERDAPEYGTGAKLRVLDQKWGHAKMQNGSLLFKDNN